MNSVKEYVSERDCVAKRGKALVKCHGKRIYFFRCSIQIVQIALSPRELTALGDPVLITLLNPHLFSAPYFGNLRYLFNRSDMSQR